MDAFRETAHRRRARQASTLARAVRAGRARANSDQRRAAAPADGQALGGLIATVAADARLVRVPLNRPLWAPTGLAMTTGDEVSWLAWGSLHLVWPLAVALRPRQALRGRVGDGVPVEGGRDTLTFRADRTGELRLCSAYPGELQADGTITIDRIPYRAMTGTLSAVVARWARRHRAPRGQAHRQRSWSVGQGSDSRRGGQAPSARTLRAGQRRVPATLSPPPSGDAYRRRLRTSTPHQAASA